MTPGAASPVLLSRRFPHTLPLTAYFSLQLPEAGNASFVPFPSFYCHFGLHELGPHHFQVEFLQNKKMLNVVIIYSIISLNFQMILARLTVIGKPNNILL